MKQQSENRKRELWIGDNLAIMRQMNSETVDLIYLDPPFNSKKMYEGNLDEGMGKQSFSDIWGDSDITEDDRRILRERNPLLAELISFLEHSHGISWKSYLSFMGIRLMEMHRLLKDTGSIYLHCDWRMSHPLKLVMDIIFGSNFRSNIIWRKTNSPKAQSRVFGAQYDDILMYTKSDDFVFNPIYVDPDESYLKSFRHKDERGRYQTVALSNVTSAGGFAKMSLYEWRGVKARWIYSKEKMESWWADNLIVKTKTGGYRKKHYLSESEGKLVSDIWADSTVPPIQGGSSERTGWATQKPLALLERIIKASSNKGDIVLDPFCGCGTACVAATNLGRQWIGIDQHPKAGVIMQDRMKKDAKLAPEWGGVKILLEKDAAKLPKRTDVAPFKKDERTKRTIYERQKGKCASGEFCLNGTDAKPINFMDFDRKLSGKRGGGYTWDNVQLLCRTCNGSKGKKTWNTFIRELKRKKADQLIKELESPEEE